MSEGEAREEAETKEERNAIIHAALTEPFLPKFTKKFSLNWVQHCS
jgi:hypothetical protein